MIPVARRETGDVWTLDGHPVVVEDGVIANSGVVDGHGQVLVALALAIVEGIDVRRRNRVAVEEVRDVGSIRVSKSMAHAVSFLKRCRPVLLPEEMRDPPEDRFYRRQNSRRVLLGQFTFLSRH